MPEVAREPVGDRPGVTVPGAGPGRAGRAPGATVGQRGDRLRAGLANALTSLRVLLVPVILWLLVVDTSAARWWAFGIFVFAAATDSLDGWAARRWDRVTAWGQLADPIADKLLVGGSLVSLAAVGDLPWWAVGVILIREVAVTVLRIRLVQRRDLVMPASSWGKVKTITQVVAVGLYLWPGLEPLYREVPLYVAVVLTVWSGLLYALQAGRLAGADQDPG